MIKIIQKLYNFKFILFLNLFHHYEDIPSDRFLSAFINTKY